MEIRRVRYDEYRMLIDVMNESFGFTDETAKIEHILPKLYWQDNPSMVHIGAFDGDKLVSSVGIYLMELVNGGERLPVACVGAVSTLPAYRGRGCFTAVLDRALDEARSMGLALLFLGGDRLRYGRFGFEFGGRNLSVGIDSRTASTLKPAPFEVIPYDESDNAVTARLLDIYNLEPMRITRTAEEFGAVLRSWNSKAYCIVSRGTAAGRASGTGVDQLSEAGRTDIVGYFSATGGNVTEAGFVCDIDTLFCAAQSICGNAHLTFPMRFYRPEILAKVNSYSVSQNHMFNILNEEAVIRFLGGDPASIIPQLPGDWRTRTRQMLGDVAYDSVTGTNIFISAANSG